MARNYNQSRATKEKGGEFAVKNNPKTNKKVVKKLKKYPAAIAIVLFLIIGAAVGYVVAPKFNSFELGSYTVNGEVWENDYAEIDLTAIKETLSAASDDPVDMDEIIKNVEIKDGGATAKFLGKSIDDTITRTVYYREDGSKPTEKVDGIDLTKAGIYYEEFTSSHFAFNSARLIRTVIVTGVEQDG